ncbi:MAG: hypothetical protein EB015_12845, partial [Methylocystaceae bacterium]|nr:hypothetical protein [Methylocystaceae bacterium]
MISRLLVVAVENEGRLLNSVSLISVQDRTQVVSTFNDTQKDIPTTTLPELFAAQVEKTPDAVAVIFGEEEVRYRELDARANQLARYLIAEGIGPEDIVAISLDRSVDMVVSLLAVLKSGAAYLPLDPEYPVERLAFMLTDSQAKRVITAQVIYDRLLGEAICENLLGGALHQDAGPLSPRMTLLLDDDVLQAELVTSSPAPISDNERVRSLSPQNLAYLIYTSGTTGKPKGVNIIHANLVTKISTLPGWL